MPTVRPYLSGAPSLARPEHALHQSIWSLRLVPHPGVANGQVGRSDGDGVNENCRHAQVVFDKFHVVANASKAVDQVRRAELRLGGKGVWESLNKSQWLWRKNPENLSPEEQIRLGKIKERNLCTATA